MDARIDEDATDQVAELLEKLHQVALAEDATLIEVNPLIVTVRPRGGRARLEGDDRQQRPVQARGAGRAARPLRRGPPGADGEGEGRHLREARRQRGHPGQRGRPVHVDARRRQPSLAIGRSIFRDDTFGDETFWTDTLRMHEVIRTAVSPDHGPHRRPQGGRPDALPDAGQGGDPSWTSRSHSMRRQTTVTLLEARSGAWRGRAGRRGRHAPARRYHSAHSATPRSTTRSPRASAGGSMAGRTATSTSAGYRVAFTRADRGAESRLRLVGPGDVRPAIQPRRAERSGRPASRVRPAPRPPLETYTGDGPVSYWNAYVAITQMHGHGIFSDPRIGVSAEQPAGSRLLQARRAARVPVEPRGPPCGGRHLRCECGAHAAARCSRVPPDA